MELQNKKIWITGASSGIGAALARELSQRGAHVALTARRPELLNSLAQDIKTCGIKALVMPGDVTKLEEMKELAEQIDKELGGVDILIANAGKSLEPPTEDFDSEAYSSLMEINYGGVLHCMEAVLPKMLARASGTVVAVASLAGYRGLPRAAAYGASKAALIHFLEAARFRLERKGIKVFIVNPGFVDTPLTKKNDFHMPFLLRTEEAAKYICDGLQAEKIKINFPFLFSLLVEIARILPYPLYNAAVKQVWKRMNYS